MTDAKTSQGNSDNAGATKRDPMKLHRVFVWGFLASLAVIGGMVWLFAAYDTANWWWPPREPRLSQDKWFEIVRNAVTTAAALGVGVTLFFSYRRQQTAEETQRIGAEAQRTAADALQLANQQHGLDQQRRLDAITSGLRGRYSTVAEQLASEHLAVRLAGVYSIAALADDWAANGNDDERQVCINLLCAYFRSQTDEIAINRKELLDTTLQVVHERLGPSTPQSKHWGSTRINLVRPGILPSLGPLQIAEKGLLTVEDVMFTQTRIRDLVVKGGEVKLDKIRGIRGTLMIHRGEVTDGGKLRITVQDRQSDLPKPRTAPIIRFHNLRFEKGALDLYATGTQVTFSGCVFEKGAEIELNVARANDNPADHLGRVFFKNCTFRTDIFADEDWAPGEDLFRLSADSLMVSKNCKFENGTRRIESFSHPKNALENS